MTKRKPKAEVIMVTNSCGCVFCDLGLDPTPVGGSFFHYVDRPKPRARFECTLKTALGKQE